MLENVDLLKGNRCVYSITVILYSGENPDKLDMLAKQVWSLVRSLIIGGVDSL